jgi:hypothetical protein
MTAAPAVVIGIFQGITPASENGVGRNLRTCRKAPVLACPSRPRRYRPTNSPNAARAYRTPLFKGIRPDTIFVPNGFGPMQKMAEELGTPLYESANLLTDDRCFDNLSGQQAYKCFACRVIKV